MGRPDAAVEQRFFAIAVAERWVPATGGGALADEAQGVEGEPGREEQGEEDCREDPDVPEIALDVVVLGTLASRQARDSGGIGTGRRRSGWGRGRCAPRLLTSFLGAVRGFRLDRWRTTERRRRRLALGA